VFNQFKNIKRTRITESLQAAGEFYANSEMNKVVPVKQEMKNAIRNRLNSNERLKEEDENQSFGNKSRGGFN